MSNTAKKLERTKGKPTGYVSATTRRRKELDKKRFDKAKDKYIYESRKGKIELNRLINADFESEVTDSDI